VTRSREELDLSFPAEMALTRSCDSLYRPDDESEARADTRRAPGSRYTALALWTHVALADVPSPLQPGTSPGTPPRLSSHPARQTSHSGSTLTLPIRTRARPHRRTASRSNPPSQTVTLAQSDPSSSLRPAQPSRRLRSMRQSACGAKSRKPDSMTEEEGTSTRAEEGANGNRSTRSRVTRASARASRGAQTAGYSPAAVETRAYGSGKVRLLSWPPPPTTTMRTAALNFTNHPAAVGPADFECLAVLMEHSQDVKCVTWHPTDEVRAPCSPATSKRNPEWLTTCRILFRNGTAPRFGLL
jgi:hypothetical protein